MGIEDARDHANRNTQAKFKDAPACKIQRNTYKAMLEFTYLLAENNGISGVRRRLLKTRKEFPSPEIDNLIEDIEGEILGHWNFDLRGNKVGKATFRELTPDDIKNNTPIANLVMPASGMRFGL